MFLHLNQNKLEISKPLIMGILNLTPDSFYDGGRNQLNSIELAMKMLENGADIIDLGGESTRPGAAPVDDKTELARIMPVLEALKANCNCILSVDTRHFNVAKAVLDAGVDIINDVSGLADMRILDLVEEYQVAYVLMHSKGDPQTMQVNPLEAGEVIAELIAFFDDKLAACHKRSLSTEKFIIDPGIGFGKSTQANQVIIKELSKFKRYNLPILMGCSRKSFIGDILNLPANQRLIGTISANIISAMHGAQILRVHDVKETAEALNVMNAIVGDQR